MHIFRKVKFPTINQFSNNAVVILSHSYDIFFYSDVTYLNMSYKNVLPTLLTWAKTNVYFCIPTYAVQLTQFCVISLSHDIKLY